MAIMVIISATKSKKHCGCCHSDLSIVSGVFPAPMPIVLGHEASGVVESVGAGVSHLKPGDHVVLTPCPPCGLCYFCVRGEASNCVNSNAIMTNQFADGKTGLSRDGGGAGIHRRRNGVRRPTPLERSAVPGHAGSGDPHHHPIGAGRSSFFF